MSKYYIIYNQICTGSPLSVYEASSFADAEKFIQDIYDSANKFDDSQRRRYLQSIKVIRGTELEIKPIQIVEKIELLG